jgi:hypothetical protein
MLDYTLNRITLFALVFVVGIVVDDSIIIAENMHRHFKMKRLPFKQAAIYAINEVGNPTILAIYCNCSNFTDGVCIRNDGPLYESDAHWCFNCHDIIPVRGFDCYPLFRISFITRKDDQKQKMPKA